jgi:hypothetical protein
MIHKREQWLCICDGCGDNREWFRDYVGAMEEAKREGGWKIIVDGFYCPSCQEAVASGKLKVKDEGE